jgi:hypothetical protein
MSCRRLQSLKNATSAQCVERLFQMNQKPLYMLILDIHYPMKVNVYSSFIL